MPVTFFAHQAPVLPIARRWPARTDGIALVTGSMAPDMAYVLNGSRWSMWAHGFPAIALFCLPVALVVAWLIARVISPVLWDHLPDMRPFRLHDYRGMSVHHFSWGWAGLSAFVGALSHVALDHFTHEWGWFAQQFDWYTAVVFDDRFGRKWTVFRIAQYLGHVAGTAVCIWMLARNGRERWMAGVAAKVEPFPVTARSTQMVAGGLLAGTGIGCGWVAVDRAGAATDIMRVSAICFAFLVAVCAALLRARKASPNAHLHAGASDALRVGLGGRRWALVRRDSPARFGPVLPKASVAAK